MTGAGGRSFRLERAPAQAQLVQTELVGQFRVAAADERAQAASPLGLGRRLHRMHRAAT